MYPESKHLLYPPVLKKCEIALVVHAPPVMCVRTVAQIPLVPTRHDTTFTIGYIACHVESSGMLAYSFTVFTLICSFRTTYNVYYVYRVAQKVNHYQIIKKSY